jgi:transposase
MNVISSNTVRAVACGYRRKSRTPPYSPQLAPIERVWKLTRRLATHNRYFATLPEVLKAVNACFNHWRRPNKVLRRLCCIT